MILSNIMNNIKIEIHHAVQFGFGPKVIQKVFNNISRRKAKTLRLQNNDPYRKTPKHLFSIHQKEEELLKRILLTTYLINYLRLKHEILSAANLLTLIASSFHMTQDLWHHCNLGNDIYLTADEAFALTDLYENHHITLIRCRCGNPIIIKTVIGEKDDLRRFICPWCHDHGAFMEAHLELECHRPLIL